MEKKLIKIETLIGLLKKEIEKGGLTIEYNGTLLCAENGNFIIITTENQM
jgi:hypothetical protein